MYDVSKHKGTASTSASFVNSDDDNPNDTLQRVLHQVTMNCSFLNIYFIYSVSNSYSMKCWMESFKLCGHLYVRFFLFFNIISLT